MGGGHIGQVEEEEEVCILDVSTADKESSALIFSDNHENYYT